MNVPRERALLSAYISERFPKSHVKIDCPLGKVPEALTFEYGPTKAYRVYRVMRPKVDALIIERDRLILIEAKVIRWVDGIAKLLLYAGMIPFTPDLSEYYTLPITKRLVIPYAQDTMIEAATANGIEVDEFTTPEINDYVQNDLARYNTRSYRREREARKDTLRMLGLEP